MILTPTQDDFDLFAKLSGDANPIHVDPDFAAKSGFGRTVAHGAMLTAWLVRAADLSEAPVSTSAMFPAPAYAGEALEVIHKGDIWQLARVHDGVVVCQLRINAALRMETPAAVSSAAGVPLRLGMAAFSQTSPDGEELRALQDLQARAAQIGLGAQTSQALAGQSYVLGRFSTLLGMALPGQGTNYLKQETVWLGAIKPGESVHARVAITRLRPEKALVDLSTKVENEHGELLAQGRALVSARDVKGAFISLSAPHAHRSASQGF